MVPFGKTLTVALALAGAVPALAAADHVQRTDRFDSATAAAGPGVRHDVRVAGAPWLRLIFKQVHLAPGDRLRITSLQDGAVQHLDATSLTQWQSTSAYFNGPAVRVELLGDRSRSRFVIDQVMAGRTAAQARPESACRGNDNWQPSELGGWTFNARLLASDQAPGCTAALMANGAFATAGQCLEQPGQVRVVEFDVPASAPDGTVNHPPPSQQYVVTDQMRWARNGRGDNWGVFTAHPNSETGLSPLQARQYMALSLGTPPEVSQWVALKGFGVDQGRENQIQHRSIGPVHAVMPERHVLRYALDTSEQGGDWGAPVVRDGRLVAIHTQNGCDADGNGANVGTLVTQPDFQAALVQLGGAMPAPGPACHDILRYQTWCGNDKLHLRAMLADASHDGQALQVQVAGELHQVPISGSTASLTLSTRGNDGPKPVWLLTPAACGPRASDKNHLLDWCD